jgi:hypothetical protein
MKARTRGRLFAPVVSGLLVVSGLVGLPGRASAASCGVWRWDVKTLSDSRRTDVDFTPQATTVKALRKKNAPSRLSENTPRLAGVEDQVWRIRAQLITATIEDDSDVHLVIASAREKKMIVEFPHPSCVDKPFKRPQMRRARREFFNACGSISSSSFTDLRGRVRITGVGFWDEDHGQTGVAPNAIELHPVLAFSRSCSRR